MVLVEHIGNSNEVADRIMVLNFGDHRGHTGNDPRQDQAYLGRMSKLLE